ncbi:MAG: helix-turn-helix transcriptional regulator [Anaeromyxobacter sp.]
MFLVRPPAEELTSRVEAFWSLRGEPGDGGRAFHEFFPDPAAHLILRLSSAGARLVLLGPVTALAAVERDGAAEYLGLRFRAGQAPALADVLPAELTDAHLELTRLGGLQVDDLAEALARQADPAARQRLLEQLLLRAPPLVRSARARRAAALVEARAGQLRVEDLAGALGMHVRSLERLCRGELGMSPKRLARLARLRHVLLRLEAGGFGTLAALAHACGYADQPHLIRDFKALTGRSPGDRAGIRPRRLGDAPDAAVVHRYRTPGR